MATYEQNDMVKSGIPTRELINLYEKFADGGFGIIITGAVMVNGVSTLFVSFYFCSFH